MWESQIDDRQLTFRLVGINNQNFIMQDEQTKSWWQQVSGEAILGPLKGRRLRAVDHDELTFALWRRERPGGRVLRPDDSSPAWKEFSDDWEEETARLPVVTRVEPDDVLRPRDVVLGLEVNGAAKAYPLRALEKQSPIVDTLGATPIVLVLGDDRKSVRAFEAAIDGAPTEFFVKAGGGAAPLALADARTGSTWDFTGRAIDGPLAGRQLKKIPVLKDYWFDWKIYHPRTQTYVIGAQ